MGTLLIRPGNFIKGGVASPLSYVTLIILNKWFKWSLRKHSKQHKLPISFYHTFKALIDLPIAIAIHSPGAVECPVFIVIPAICGDQAKLVISACAEYAMTGSVTIRFFTSGRGELRRELAGPRGEVTFCVYAARSQSSNWQSSPVNLLSSVDQVVYERHTSCCQQRILVGSPSQGIDLSTMCSELHHRLPRTTHIQYLNIRPIHVESRHVI